MGKGLVLLGAFAVSVALVGTALASHSWGRYHWEGSTAERTLAVGDNLTGNAGWSSHLAVAITDWNASSVIQLQPSAGRAGASCSPIAGRIEVCNGTYGDNGWLGIAQIWASGKGHITQALSKMNDTYFGGAPYNTPAWRQLVMCQEIAHDFGLDHQDENFDNPNLGSCMDYTSDPSTNQHPNEHDFEQLETIYGHLDGTSGGAPGGGCKGKKCPGSGLDNAPPFSQASRANGHVYVDHLANGGRRITHVFWTPFGE